MTTSLQIHPRYIFFFQYISYHDINVNFFSPLLVYRDKNVQRVRRKIRLYVSHLLLQSTCTSHSTIHISTPVICTTCTQDRIQETTQGISGLHYHLSRTSISLSWSIESTVPCLCSLESLEALLFVIFFLGVKFEHLEWCRNT